MRFTRPVQFMAAVALVAFLAPANAAPPSTINYQGNLTNASAQPVNNGAITMTFSLYAAASGGAPLYSETQTVSVSNGLFNVRIGTISPINLPFDVPYFLGISVAGDAEMSPRQPLSSSAYAFRASTADAVSSAASIAASQVAGSLANATIPAANVVGGVGGGTVTSVATSPGLIGGPITTSGTIGLATTNLLPTTACVANQIPKWSGAAWVCANDLAGTGTVTSITAGSGLTGGTIAASGTIGLAATNLLPTTACASGQTPVWSVNAWTCGAASGLPSGGSNGALLNFIGGVPQWRTNPYIDGPLGLASATPSGGNLYVGGALYLHDSGVKNTFVGPDAGNLVNPGSMNTAVGYQALKAPSNTGQFNVAVGHQAMQANTSGTANTALGNSALLSNTTGSFNVAAGSGAASALLSGTSNVAVGSNALGAATTSLNNIAVGSGAIGATATPGNSNIGIGFVTLNSNRGDQNVAIGDESMVGNQTGTQNAAFGRYALRSNTTGNNNTALGPQALNSTTTGSNNIGLGVAGGGGITTGSNNIMIGNEGTSLDTSTIRIGNGQTHTYLAGVYGTSTGPGTLPVVMDSGGRLGTSSVTVGSVTTVFTGAGLTGGPIVSTGTVGLAATNLLPTTACATNESIKWNGTAWICAADANSGGTVTSVVAGSGLTGGTITGAGTIGLAATNLLPTAACATGEIPRWSVNAWTCAIHNPVPSGGATGQVLTHTGSDSAWSSSPSLGGNLMLADSTTVVAGNIMKGGIRFMSNPGTENTFLGRDAGFPNTVGVNSGNTAVGALAMRGSEFGTDNAAFGRRALNANVFGDQNTAIGAYALQSVTGSNNIAIGYLAGFALMSGNNNVAIANDGVNTDSNTTRIGTDGNQTRTFISGIHGVTPGVTAARLVSIDSNGQLATESSSVGLGTTAPENKLHIAKSIDGNGIPSNHVVQIENTSTGTSPDVLALRIRTTGNVNAGMNFITFYNGDFVSGAGGADQTLGSIQGNGTNSIVLAGAGNDFAEYVPKLDPSEVMQPGDVVGVRGGKVTRDLNGAEQIMVVSTGAIVAGNDPGEGKRDQYALLAFIGQANVKVAGLANAGDYLIASGNIAIAVPPSAINVSLLSRVVGRAWASSSELGVKPLRAVVGVDRGNEAILKVVSALEGKAARMERELAAIKETLGLK